MPQLPHPVRDIDPNARRRIRQNRMTFAGWLLFAINLPLFIASDVVGMVEFALPTHQANAVVTEVGSYGPLHHFTTFQYEVVGYERSVTSVQDTSWSASPGPSVGDAVQIEYQASDVDHARLLSQRKYPVTLWQALILPAVGFLFVLAGWFRGRRRERLARTGELIKGRLQDQRIAFDLDVETEGAGYRDQGREQKTYYVQTRAKRESSGSNPLVVYPSDKPERAIALTPLGIRITASDSLAAEAVEVPRGCLVLWAYVIFGGLLLAYAAAETL